MKAIVTGISGQDEAYLALHLLNNGIEVVGIVSNNESTLGGLRYLGIESDVEIVEVSLENKQDVNTFIRKSQSEYIFNLAAQSSVAESFKHPHSTILFNLHSTLNILEAIRNFSLHIHLYQP